jgi:hypothetical protein
MLFLCQSLKTAKCQPSYLKAVAWVEKKVSAACEKEEKKTHKHLDLS